MKLNISMNDDLVARLEKLAGENYMTRSGIISVACAEYVNQVELVSLVKGLALSINKLASKGLADDEVADMLEDYQRLVELTGYSK